MVSKAHVLSANSPDLRDIMTLHASGVPAEVVQSYLSISHRSEPDKYPKFNSLQKKIINSYQFLSW